MKKQRQGSKKSWPTIIKMLKEANLPWGHYILSALIGFAVATIFGWLPQLEGEIAGGDIFDMGKVARYVLFAIIGSCSQLVGAYTIWVDVTFVKRLQQHAWRRFIRLPMTSFEKVQPSTLISRVTEDSTLVSQIISTIINVAMTAWSSAILIYGMFTQHLTLSLMTLPLIILNAICFIITRSFVYDIGYSQQDALARLTQTIAERVKNMRIVKAFCREPEEFRRGAEVSQDRYKADMRQVTYNTVILAVMQISTALLTAIVLIGGAYFYSKHEMDTSALVTFYMTSVYLPNIMQQLMTTFLQLRSYQGSVEIVTSMAGLPSEQLQRELPMTDLQDSICFRNLSFNYPGTEHKVLDNVSFCFPKGKTTAIVGPSGSGKTTLLKLLERFYVPTEGEILYNGEPVEKYHLDSWRRHFAYIIQNSPILSGSIKDNILYGARREISNDELVDIAKKAQIYDFIQTLEKGFDTEVGVGGSNLSGGQRQRIAIARALAADPEILIMDEATSNLDTKNSHEVQVALRNLMQGKTVIVVAHQMKTIRHADQIIVLKDGQIEATGNHQSLCQGDSYYNRYCTLQNLAVN